MCNYLQVLFGRPPTLCIAWSRPLAPVLGIMVWSQLAGNAEAPPLRMFRICTKWDKFAGRHNSLPFTIKVFGSIVACSSMWWFARIILFWKFSDRMRSKCFVAVVRGGWHFCRTSGAFETRQTLFSYLVFQSRSIAWKLKLALLKKYIYITEPSFFVVDNNEQVSE